MKERASCSLVCFEDLQCLYLFGGTGYNPQNLAKKLLNWFAFGVVIVFFLKQFV